MLDLWAFGYELHFNASNNYSSFEVNRFSQSDTIYLPIGAINSKL